MKPTLLDLLLRSHPELTEREARGRIVRGDVTVDGEPLTKPGVRLAPGVSIAVKPGPRFVSRAGDKLDDALDRLDLDVRGGIVVDAGSSTGGFTDCLLSRGASLVHCVDVGRGLLAWKLRTDARVKVHEGTNIMCLRPGDLAPVPHFGVCDLSFRSVVGAAAHLLGLVTDAWVLALVKPQFEWPGSPREFDGVVRDEGQRSEILDRVTRALEKAGVTVEAVCPSALSGRKGNRECFYLIKPSRRGALQAVT